MCIWNIKEDVGPDGSAIVVGEAITRTMHYAFEAGGAFSQLLWHPVHRGILCFADGPNTLVVNMKEFTGGGTLPSDRLALTSPGVVLCDGGQRAGAILDLCFSPSGSHLFTASAGGTVKSWIATPGGLMEVCAPPPPRRNREAAFPPCRCS